MKKLMVKRFFLKNAYKIYSNKIMKNNDSIVGGNHKYLQVSINTDNVKEILLFLYNEVTQQRNDLNSLTNKFTELQKSDKTSKLNQNLDEYCIETNKKFEEFNATINSLLKSFTTHQECMKEQIKKVNNDIQKNVTNKFELLENKIAPLYPLLERIGKLQTLCDEVLSDNLALDRLKHLKDYEDDIAQLKIKIQNLEESQKKLNNGIKQATIRKGGSFTAGRVSLSNNSEKDKNSITQNDNNNDSNIDKNETNNNDNNKIATTDNLNSDNKNLLEIQKEAPTTKSDQKKIINNNYDRYIEQTNSQKNKKSSNNTSNNHDCSNHLYNFEDHSNSNKSAQNKNTSSNNASQSIEKGGPTSNSVKSNDNSPNKTDSHPTKESSRKNDNFYDRLNSKKARTETHKAKGNQDNTQTNSNSKTSQNNSSLSGREGRHVFSNSPRAASKNYPRYSLNHSDHQRIENSENDQSDYDSDISNELEALKELLTLQSQQLSSLMQPDSLLLSTIAKIVSEMLEKRKSEIDGQNDIKLQHIYGEMQRNIDAMRAQVESANEKIENCATKNELINVADDILSNTMTDNGVNTSIGATPLCYCLACGKPKSSVSTLSRMTKVNSPLFLDRGFRTILNYKPISESVSFSQEQNHNTNPGARVKLLIGEKSKSMNTIPKMLSKTAKPPPLPINDLESPDSNQ